MVQIIENWATVHGEITEIKPGNPEQKKADSILLRIDRVDNYKNYRNLLLPFEGKELEVMLTSRSAASLQLIPGKKMSALISSRGRGIFLFDETSIEVYRKNDN